MKVRRCHSQLVKLQAMLEAATVCPSNEDIARALNLSHPSAASDMLQRLAEDGVIRLERLHYGKRVTIVATGKALSTPLPTSVDAYRAGIDGGFRGPVPEHQRVDREPCPRCGVRADIGCRHSASRLIAAVHSL